MKRTIFFNNKPKIISVGSVGGPKEANSNVGEYIDVKLKDDKFRQKSFEKAESKMLYTALDVCIDKSGLKREDIDVILSGDLLNQIISSTFAVRSFESSYLGLYTACATFTEALALGSTLIDGKYYSNVICATSSHFSSAERQYRYPLELGSTRPPESQWTVTGAGATMLSLNGNGPKISCATIGRVVDFGVKDVNNMGGAMAPSAVDTLCNFFRDTNTNQDNYDAIITGDLGVLGSKIFDDLMWERGYNVIKKHFDCGAIIYEKQENEYQGGSGAGCSSLVFNSLIYNKLIKKEYKRIVLLATGALLSSVSSGQGESIPAIAHAVLIEV